MSRLYDELISSTIYFVKEQIKDYDSGHDWFHIERVWKMAKRIAEEEKGIDLLVVELSALLHDVGDYKFHDGAQNSGPQIVRNFLEEFDLPRTTILHVESIVKNVSYSSENTPGFHSKELEIVQDADRLDAMGAIGIARAFNFGGYKGRSIYDPDIPAQANLSKEEYKKNKGPTINHFYEKLLLLKGQMNTNTGRSIAEARHDFMKQYLEQFYKEWKGEL